jgi:adenylylsulfate kinase
MTFTIWFMGRPAAGKSTIAKRVDNELRDRGLPIENLDGDELRNNLHPDLGFTREERAINNRRTAFVSRLLNRNGIPTIVAMITPFRDAQKKAQEIVEQEGRFMLVYVKCSAEACAERDPKGLYKQAQAGEIPNFTGVNHPFQEPIGPDVIIDTERNSVDSCVTEVMDALTRHGVIDNQPIGDYKFAIAREEEAAIEDRLRRLGYL